MTKNIGSAGLKVESNSGTDRRERAHSVAPFAMCWNFVRNMGCSNMNKRLAVVIGAWLAFLLPATNVRAQDKEPSAIIEVGGVGEWSRPGWRSSFGPSLGVEFTAIKDWLEIETSISTLFRRGHSEYGTDFLFKKPFPLSDKVEFMFGVGPSMSYTNGDNSAKFAGQVAFDFMFWPSAERRFGWFLEPTYSYSFNKGHEQSIAVSVGLLIGIP
jgi:hypothetical protein